MSEETLVGYVKRRLKEEGPSSWPQIALAVDKPLSILRKIAYGDRTNPRVDTIEPIANHLRKRELRRRA